MPRPSPTFTGAIGLLWLVCIALLGLAACSGPRGPELLNVADVGPGTIEVGDKLEFSGEGFPAGKQGKLVFRGTSYRPGEEPKAVRVSLPVQAETAHLLVLPIHDSILNRFTFGGGVHATFRGDVTVEFTGRSQVVFGVLADVALDFLPRVGREQSALAAKTLEENADELLTLLGIELNPDNPLEVLRVHPNKPAALAGVKPKDRLKALDGVNLLTKSDLVVSGADPSARLFIERGPLKTAVEMAVDVSRFRPFGRDSLSITLLVVAIVSCLLLVLRLPGARWFSWAERQAITMLERARGDWGGKTKSPIGASMAQVADATHIGAGPLRPVAYLLLLAVGWTFALIGSGSTIVGADWDVPLLYLWAVTVLTVKALLDAGERGQSWSLWQALRGAGRTILLQLPGAVALVSLLGTTGTLRALELVHEQGALPWEWRAFDGPLLLASALLWLVPMLPSSARPRSALAGLGLLTRSSERPWRQRIALSEWLYLLTLAHLGAILFFGGWQLPWEATIETHLRVLLVPLHVVTLEAKAVCIVALVLAARWTLVLAPAERLTSLWVRLVLPSAFALLGLVLGFAWLERRHGPLPALDTGPFLFGCALAAGVLFLTRVARGLKRPTTSVLVNPWL